MIGDQRKYNVAGITLIGANGELAYADELDPPGRLTAPGGSTITEARSNQEWIKKITETITAPNSEQKICLSNTLKIKMSTTP